MELPPDGQKWDPLSHSENDDEKEEPKLKRAKITINHEDSNSIIPGNHSQYQDGQQFIFNDPVDAGRSLCLFESQDNQDSKNLDAAKSNFVSKNKGRLFESQLQTSTERSSRARPPKVFYFLGNELRIKQEKRDRDKQKKDKLINYSIDVFGEEQTEKELSKSILTHKRLIKNGKTKSSGKDTLKSSQIIIKDDKKQTDLRHSMPSEEQKLDGPSIVEKSTTLPKTDENLSTDFIDCSLLSEKDLLEFPSSKKLPKCDSLNSHSIKPEKETSSKSFTKQNINRSSKKNLENDRNSPDVIDSTQNSENRKRLKTNFEYNKHSESSYCILSKIKEKSSTKSKKRLTKNYYPKEESQEMFKELNFPKIENPSKSFHKLDKTILSYSAQDVFEPMKYTTIQQNKKQNVHNITDVSKYSEVSEGEKSFERPQLKYHTGSIEIVDQDSGKINSDKSNFEEAKRIFEPDCSKNELDFQGFLKSLQDGSKNMFSSEQNSETEDCFDDPLRGSSSYEFKDGPEIKMEKKSLRYSNIGRYVDPVTEPEVPDDNMTFSSYSIESQHEHFEIPEKQANTSVKDEFNFLKVEMFDNYEKFKSQNVLVKNEKNVSTDDLINEMKTILEEANFETDHQIYEQGQTENQKIKIENIKTVPEELIKNIKLLRVKSKEELIDRKTTAKYTFTYKDFLW